MRVLHKNTRDYVCGRVLKKQTFVCGRDDLIASIIHDAYSVGPSIRQMCTRCCFTMTNMIQMGSNFDQAPIFIAHTRMNEILMIFVCVGGERTAAT